MLQSDPRDHVEWWYYHAAGGIGNRKIVLAEGELNIRREMDKTGFYATVTPSCKAAPYNEPRRAIYANKGRDIDPVTSMQTP